MERDYSEIGKLIQQVIQNVELLFVDYNQKRPCSLHGRFAYTSKPPYRPKLWYSRLGNIPVAEASRLVKLNMAAVSAISKIAWSEKPTPRR